MASLFYSEHERFPVAVDCIIFSLRGGRLHLLLAPRRFEPNYGVPSLMGGFVRAEETVDDAAIRVLSELTGLENVFMHQVGAFGSLDRDPGARVISVAYYALIKEDEAIDRRLASYGASWVPINCLPKLAFDHPKMVERALESLRIRVSIEPIGFHLLPEFFTLTQAQALFEAILGVHLDKRNFRRRIYANNYVKPTDKVDKMGSRRGAVMYSFDWNLYDETQSFAI